MKRLSIFLILVFCGFSQKAKCDVVTSVTYNSKTYYVDVVKTSTDNTVSAQIWLRVSNNAESIDDIKVFDITTNTKDFTYYAGLACRSKELIDNGLTALGCSTVIGSVFCAVGTAATDGALAMVCTTTWDYAVEKGAADCLKGAADAIADYLHKKDEWRAIGLIASLDDPHILESIDQAINYMCDDIKAHSN